MIWGQKRWIWGQNGRFEVIWRSKTGIQGGLRQNRYLGAYSDVISIRFVAQTKMTYLSRDDEWMTPMVYWNMIKEYIPTSLTLWEPFPGNGQSTKDLRSLGYKVVNGDFFTSVQADIVVTNPPYSMKKKILQRLETLKINYVLLLPAKYMFTQQWMATKNTSVAVCPKRFGFMKNGVVKKNLPFTCAFFCKGIKTPSHYFVLKEHVVQGTTQTH